MSRIVTTALAAAALLAVAGCDFLSFGRGGASGTGAATPATMARLDAEIQLLTQPPSATRAASCRAVAYGSKACGGPSRAVIFSTEKTDSTRLRTLTDRYTTLEDEHNRRTGAVSDCMFLMTPEVTLGAGGVCVAKR